jgi:hypothetical protein
MTGLRPKSFWSVYGKRLQNPGPCNNNDEVVPMIGPLDKFESAMREHEKSVPLTFSIEQKRIDHFLDDFKTVPRLNSAENVLEWWYNSKNEMPELFRLAEIVHGVPVTQVSVEKSFSNLKFVLSVYRTNLSPSLLEEILLIRCNEKFEK